MQNLFCIAEDKSNCANHRCVHGTCIPTEYLYKCECDEGYMDTLCNSCDWGYHEEGEFCVEDSPCAPDPCVHGDCAEQGGSAACSCEQGYDGQYCDECANGYHPDRMICVPDIDGDLDGDTDGDEDGDVDGDIDGNPCSQADCEPNRVCVSDGDSYTCPCAEGHTESAGLCLVDCDVDQTYCDFAKSSFNTLVSANGYSAIMVDLESRKAAHFFEHPYQTWGINQENKRANTRDILYDSYLGLKVDGAGTWLNSLPVDAAQYYNQDGIPQLVQTAGDIRVESFFYAPFSISRPAMMMIGRVTNEGESERNVSLYSLHNYHIGRTVDTLDETGVEPDSSDERIVYHAQSGAYVESGPGGSLVHYPIGVMAHHGAGAADAANPWQRLNNNQDLGDEADTGIGDDRACGFQGSEITLQPGEQTWIAVVSVFERSQDASTILTELENIYSSKTHEEVLSDSLAEWSDWRNAMPQGLSASERLTYRVSEAVLRMSQVLEESDKSHGQILASLPPGIWSIAWVRDMSYSIRALIRSAHLKEAGDALSFMLEADSGAYNNEVGLDYQISICRYFGNGTEETDFNAFGPNIEFDGFGLFLWVLGEYIAAGGDMQLVSGNWTLIKEKIAGALVGLVDNNGMIKPDSSIWEVHWDGMQKQFTYTSLAAERGLCAASALAEAMEDVALSELWKAAAAGIHAAIENHALDNDFLVQSLEEYDSGNYVDAAVMDAFNWMLFDPEGPVFDATFTQLDNTLKAAHGFGYFRNDDAGEYDSKEWVFVDMRMAQALRAAGETAKADALVDWITAQAVHNFGLIAELHHPQSGVYDGAIPMAGFGAGAYMLNLWKRQEPEANVSACSSSWDVE